MRDAVFEALFQNGNGVYGAMTEGELADVKANMLLTYDAVVAYIVASMEISGIEVADPAETVETYAAGVGDNGGTLTGQIPIVGNVKQAAKTRTQSNDGTGRVS